MKIAISRQMLPPMSKNWKVRVCFLTLGERTYCRSKSVDEDTCYGSSSIDHKGRKWTNPGDIEVWIIAQLMWSVILLKNTKGVYKAKTTEERKEWSGHCEPCSKSTNQSIYILVYENGFFLVGTDVCSLGGSSMVLSLELGGKSWLPVKEAWGFLSVDVLIAVYFMFVYIENRNKLRIPSLFVLTRFTDHLWSSPECPRSVRKRLEGHLVTLTYGINNKFIGMLTD